MEKVKKVTLSGMLFAIGLILPFFIGQIPAVGKMLLPMHIPVLICGLILGWQYGLAVGFLLPLVRSVLFGMPVLYPNAIAMAFEMGTYGLEKRNGSEKAVEFQKKWIPLEELYFEKCRTRSRCGVCFTMCDEM